MDTYWPHFFQGLKVVELASVLAGPSVGRFFMEHGAEVIKIENPNSGGDVTRTWRGRDESDNGLSAYYCSVNQGKDVRWLDLKNASGQQELYNLLAQADVFLCNFKPGEDSRRGLELSMLRERYPELIIAQLDSFPEGDDRPAYDIVLQAETGFLSMTGTAGDALARMPVALIDILAGHQLKSAVLMALLHREKTGEGSLVNVNLWESAVASLANQGSAYLMTGKIPGPQGTLHPQIAPYGEVFTCIDGKKLVMAIGNDKQFGALCTLLNHPEWLSDPRFSGNPQRVKNRTELYRLMQMEIAQNSRAHWIQQLGNSGIPAGAVLNLEEILTSGFAKPLIQVSRRGNQMLKSLRMSVVKRK